MKRVNFRSFLYSSIFLMLTIFFCLIAVNIVWLGVILLALSFIFPVVRLIAVGKKTAKYKNIMTIATIGMCLIAVVLFFVQVASWSPSHIQSGKYAVTGVVDDIFDADGNRVIIKDITLGGEKVPGRMQISLMYGNISVEPGYKLSFTAKVVRRELVDGFRVNASYLRSNIRYTSTVSASQIEVSFGKDGLLGSFTHLIKDTIMTAMGEKYGAVAYGMLSGDKNEISSQMRETFSIAGIAHILAVSGLHIGFLVGVITFILRKFKLKRLLIFVINCIVLLMYCLFAGFSPSVVRACLMFLVAGGAMLSGEQKDGLNSLGFAASVIMTFSPLMLFEAGFIMSVGAVGAIIAFSPIFTDALIKIKIPEKLSSALSMSASAQLGVLPACISFYGTLQTYSIVVNVILMPFMSIAFIVVFVSLIFALIPPLRFLLTVSGYLIRGLTVAASAVSLLPLAQIPIASSAISLTFYPMYFVQSGFVRVDHRAEVNIFLTALMVTIVLILIFI